MARRFAVAVLGLGVLFVGGGVARLTGQEIGSPQGISSEQALPSRYPYVVEDMLGYCAPKRGCWIDLGAGKGQIAIPLAEDRNHPVIMVDPDVDAMAEGLALAREKGLQDKLFAVVGVAEQLPFPDNSVDLLVSRGSIFFWEDPVKGLREVYRVLRPGCRAYIGGGAGSGYPAEATEKLIEQRKEKLQGEHAEKWRDFVRLRRPEQMQRWARDAGLPEFEVFGKGAISAEDTRVGQGIWVLFEKLPEVTMREAGDTASVRSQGKTAVYGIRSASGIGRATITPWMGWKERVILRLHLKGLESLVVSNGTVQLEASVLSHSGNPRHLTLKDADGERKIREGDSYWMPIEALDARGEPTDGLPGPNGCFQVQLPAALLGDSIKSLRVEWVDFYR